MKEHIRKLYLERSAEPLIRLHRCLLLTAAALFAGCASNEPVRVPPTRTVSASEARALVERVLPATVSDRKGWAIDIYAPMAALDLPPTADNVCAVIAVTEQETGFRVDPAVPGLSKIARSEIEKQRERTGVPRLVLHAALLLPSSDGRSYSERLDAVRTERQLSDLFEDFTDMVPLGKTVLANRNPVRTAGPMQVSVAFSENHAANRTYPYPVSGTIRHEVFTRRGGMYFGIAHLLDYPASYASHRYRFADFNAGWYASRNAAFQSAVTLVSGIPLELDGDLLRYEHGQPSADPASTERAVRTLAGRLDMTHAQIRRDLELGKTQRFEHTRLYRRVFALADELSGRPPPRAVLPQLVLQSPKITRRLTTAWFATRVESRYRTCLERATVKDTTEPLTAS
jgi:hypothetical protein